jgi:hypothetical protein
MLFKGIWLIQMVLRVRISLTTCRLGDGRSITELPEHTMWWSWLDFRQQQPTNQVGILEVELQDRNGVPGVVRTHDLQLRKLPLYLN